MAVSHTPQRYNVVSVMLHWLMLALIAAAYVTAELQEGGDGAEAIGKWHYAVGLSVLLLVWLRIVARLVWRAPEDIERGWRNALSKIIHGALYMLMIVMPLAGWLILSAEGEEILLLGLRLPLLVGPDRELAEWFEGVHEAGGTLGYWLIGLHAAAALFHHYILRDGLLARMLPGRA